MSAPVAPPPKAEDVLGQLSLYVRANAGLAKPAEKPDKKRFFVLVLLAFDLTAFFWLLTTLFDSLLADLLLKSLPAVMGVVLVSYMDPLREGLVKAAGHWLFQLVVVLAFFFLVIPILTPYRVAFRIPPGSTVYLDGKLVSPKTTDSATGESKLWISGFTRHDIRVGEFDMDRRERLDTFLLGRRALIRAGLRAMSLDVFPEPHFRLDLALLQPKSVATPDSTALIGVAGTFPYLFLAQARQKHDVVQLGGDTVEIRVIHHRGALESIPLPIGYYSFRYLKHGCWSTPVADSVSPRHEERLDLKGVQCAKT